MTTFSGIEIGKRAILAQQKAMSVTSHNIANANTDGYSRQRAVLSASQPYLLPYSNQVGTGVLVTQIENFRNEFIDAKMVTETSTMNYREAADNLLKEIEVIFNEPGDATIRDQFDKFWAAWEELSLSPSSSELRQNLLEQTQTLISAFQDAELRLTQLQGTPDHTNQGSIENQLDDTLLQVNNLAHQICDLNVQIARAEGADENANDLRDKRQKAIEELAELINVDQTYNSKGYLTLRCGGHVLVDHSKVNELHIVCKDGIRQTTISGENGYPEYSDDTSVATAYLTHTANQRNITLTVSQTAQAHSVYSYLTFHPLTGPLSDFGTSSGTFEINGRTFELDAENTTMNGLVKMINDAGLNISASLNEAGQLVMTSTQTGTDYAMETKDGTSNLITILNLQQEKAARDAQFNFAGNQYTSSSNEVTEVLPGVTLVLNGTGVANLHLIPTVTSGKLKGLLEVRDGTIDSLRNKLDMMVYNLVTEVNYVHRQGFGLDGVTGRNFFNALSSDDPSDPYKDAVKNFAVADHIINNLNTIAASSGTIENPTDRLRTYNGDGDGSNAISIAQIKYTNFFNDGKANFNDFYNEIITQAAVESQRYEREAQYSRDLIYQLDSKRQELSGVSLDEELTNLIKFQHAYNAAAKTISTMDEMLDKIINGMI